jgi:hypothetical protein
MSSNTAFPSPVYRQRDCNIVFRRYRDPTTWRRGWDEANCGEREISLVQIDRVGVGNDLYLFQNNASIIQNRR